MKDKSYKAEDLTNNLRSIEELKVIPIGNYKIVLSNESDDAGLVFEVDGTDYILPINKLESITASFHLNAFSEKAHIHDIYASYVNFTKVMHLQMSQVIIESKHGDMVYARIIWKDNESKLFTQVTTACDAFILSHLSKAKIGIVTALLEELEAFTDWPYSYDVDDW